MSVEPESTEPPVDPEAGRDVDPDEIDRALNSFWRGSASSFDALLRDDDPQAPDVCQLLHGVVVASQELPESAGTTPAISGYDILHRIGQGATAVVYEAVQQATGRRVALKIVHQAGRCGDTARLARREIETLARLKHPNIAALYDAGATADGRPFFALELVEGANLVDALAARPASGRAPPADAQTTQAAANGARAPGGDDLARRLRMFVTVCRAMNHAHQRAVIHRDLKPSNIIVDEHGQPKVLDFGLAQLADPDRSLTFGAADGRSIIGTLHYMSPEQARGTLGDVDVRSDVYSLGVILYELLTGRRPFDWRDASLPRMVADICGAAPPRPGQLRPELRGDLELIILSAVDKDPARRYQSAAGLADDIERYLGDQPILARGPSAAYQFRKFLSRHREAAAIAGLLLAVLAVSAAAYVRQAQQTARQRDRAQAEARRAERINTFLSGMFASVDPRDVGANVPVREVLDQAAVNLQRESFDDPETQATLHDTLGRSYLVLGLFERAEPHLRQALDLRRELFGEHHRQYADSLHQLGILLRLRGRPRDAGELLQRGLAMRRELLGNDHPDVAESLLALAQSRRWLSDFRAAETLYRDALAILRQAGGEARATAECLRDYASMLVSAGRYEEAEPMLTEALTIQRRVLGGEHFDVARTLADLCEILSYYGEYERAEPLYRDQVRILRSAFPEGHKDLAAALSDLAPVVAARGAYDEAEALYREAAAMELRILGEGKNALSLNNYAAFLREQGRFREAEPLCRAVFRIWRGDAAEPHQAKGYACQNLAAVLVELGRYDEAERLFRDAAASWRAQFGAKHPKLAFALIGLGRLQLLRGDPAAAEALFREAVEVRRQRLGEEHAETAAARMELAESLAEQDRPESLDLGRAAAAAIDRRRGESGAESSWALARLAVIQHRIGDAASAERSFRRAIELERQLPRRNHPSLADALAGLSLVWMDGGRMADAEPLLREAVDIRRSCVGEAEHRLALFEGALGETLTALNRFDEASPLLTASERYLRNMWGEQHRESRRAAERLERFRRFAGRPADAAGN